MKSEEGDSTELCILKVRRTDLLNALELPPYPLYRTAARELPRESIKIRISVDIEGFDHAEQDFQNQFCIQ